jgi:hypothetical protein
MTCPEVEDLVEGCVRAETGTLILAPFAGPAMLVQITDARPGACRSPDFDDSRNPFPSSAMGKRLLFTFGEQAWFAIVRMPDLPPGWLTLGEEFEMTLTVSQDPLFHALWNQTFVLVRADGSFVFAATLHRGRYAPRPELEEFGIFFEDDGLACELPSATPKCEAREHRLGVTVGGERTVTQAGQSGRVGRLAFTVDAFSDQVGGCDRPGFTQVVGFYAAAP